MPQRMQRARGGFNKVTFTKWGIFQRPSALPVWEPIGRTGIIERISQLPTPRLEEGGSLISYDIVRQKFPTARIQQGRPTQASARAQTFHTASAAAAFGAPQQSTKATEDDSGNCSGGSSTVEGIKNNRMKKGPLNIVQTAEEGDILRGLKARLLCVKRSYKNHVQTAGCEMGSGIMLFGTIFL